MYLSSFHFYDCPLSILRISRCESQAGLPTIMSLVRLHGCAGWLGFILVAKANHLTGSSKVRVTNQMCFKSVLYVNGLHTVKYITIFLVGFTSHQHYYGSMVTFHLYWWREISCAPPCIISGRNGPPSWTPGGQGQVIKVSDSHHSATVRTPPPPPILQYKWSHNCMNWTCIVIL